MFHGFFLCFSKMFHGLFSISCVLDVSRETLSSVLFLIFKNVSRETFNDIHFKTLHYILCLFHI